MSDYLRCPECKGQCCEGTTHRDRVPHTPKKKGTRMFVPTALTGSYLRPAPPKKNGLTLLPTLHMPPLSQTRSCR